MRERYYHGGNRGLNVGDYLLPPEKTGAATAGGSHPLHRRDRVYLTKDINAAQFFASGSPKPIVYEVIPEGEIEADPDSNEKPGVTVACEKAKIIALRKIPGKIIKKSRKKMLAAPAPKQ